MSDRPELMATHPETGKRHRWEVGEIRQGCPGEFIMYFGGEFNELVVAKYGEGVSRYIECPILRDLGPVEEYPLAADVTRLKARVEELSDTLSKAWKASSIYRTALNRSELARQQAETRVSCHEGQLSRLSSDHLAYRVRAEKQLASLESQLTESRHQVTDLFRERAELKTTIAILKARIDNATAELERLSPAPLPVGVVRLPIAESNDDDDNFTEFGTFRLDVLEYPQAGDVVLVPAYMRGASFQAVTVPRALPTNDRDNLRILLRRLDAPEAKTPERPAFIGSMPDLPDGFPRDDAPEEKQPEKPANPFAGAGPITAKAWELRKANDEKPAPPKEETKPGWDPYFDPLLRPTVRNIYLRPYSMTLDHC